MANSVLILLLNWRLEMLPIFLTLLQDIADPKKIIIPVLIKHKLCYTCIPIANTINS